MQNSAPKMANSRKLERFVSTAFQSAGVPLGDADLTASILIDADLRGIDSHGVMNLYSTYVKKLLTGSINRKPNLTLAFGSPTTASLDGDNGLGFVASHKAMTACIEMA
ncbi:MAG TPA: Ldh family oxidoreductase, partial [Candidatus Methylomirabilis sp.]